MPRPMLLPDRRSRAGVARRAVLAGLAGTAATVVPGVARAQVALPRARPLATLITDDAVDVRDFIPARLHPLIAAGTCSDDLAPYVNKAVRAVLQRPSGGILFFAAGTYPVSEIDATNSDPAQFYTQLRIVGAGRLATRIVPARPAAILLNAAGRNSMTVESIHFHSHEHESAIGILLARTAASPNAAGNQFRDVLVSGNFATAPVVSIAAETTSWQGCQFGNSNSAARHRCFVTSGDPAALQLAKLPLPRLVAGPNTGNAMIDCIFDCAYPGAEPILFDGHAAYGMVQCSILGGEVPDTRLVRYRPVSGTFTGPVAWMNCHFEATGARTIVHALDAPLGPSYFRGIDSYSGNYVVGNGAALLAATGPATAQPVLMGSTWTVPQVPWGVRDVAFRVFAVSESQIDVTLGDATGTIEVAGFAKASTLRATRRVVAQTVP